VTVDAGNRLTCTTRAAMIEHLSVQTRNADGTNDESTNTASNRLSGSSFRAFHRVDEAGITGAQEMMRSS
jgi:hypothetical protein